MVKFKSAVRKPRGGVRVYTLYMLRHGEAAHNVLEKRARKRAREAAIEEGYASDSEECERRMEDARRNVLDDESLLDSPLTDQGIQQARDTAKLVKELQAKGLPEPTEVLVSPLQRALQTADLVFPDCNNIHVRLELQERQTGKPCDTRQPAEVIQRRQTFRRFSVGRLSKEERVTMLDSINKESTRKLPELLSTSVEKYSGEICKKRDSSTLQKIQVEEKEMVRERAKKVFDFLAESDHRVVCIVTHKGYLRELERGHLGQPMATEFGNCEVRVYRFSIDPSSGSNLPHNVQRLEPPMPRKKPGSRVLNWFSLRN